MKSDKLFVLGLVLFLTSVVGCGGGGGSSNDNPTNENKAAQTTSLEACDPFKIVGGQQCDSPNTALVRILTDGLCTGTVVAPDLILTAAHCFSGALAETTIVALSGDSTQARAVFVPSPWIESQFIGADLALIKVDPNFISGNNLKIFPILNLRAAAVDLNATNFYVSGYGLTPGAQLDIASLPSSARMNLVEWDQNSGVITMIDNAEDTGNACTGDSGAPLVIELPGSGFFMVGIVSSGIFSNDCTKDRNTRFVDLSNALATPLLNQYGL